MPDRHVGRSRPPQTLSAVCRSSSSGVILGQNNDKEVSQVKLSALHGLLPANRCPLKVVDSGGAVVELLTFAVLPLGLEGTSSCPGFIRGFNTS